VGLGFGTWALGWASRGAEVEMPGRAEEAMGEEGRRGSRALGLVRPFVVFLMLSVAKMIVSVWR